MVLPFEATDKFRANNLMQLSFILATPFALLILKSILMELDFFYLVKKCEFYIAVTMLIISLIISNRALSIIEKLDRRKLNQ